MIENETAELKMAPSAHYGKIRRNLRLPLGSRREVTTVTSLDGSLSGCPASLTRRDRCQGHRSLLV